MGCANSKLNPEGDFILPIIRPVLLRNKLAEFRKRKNGTNLRDKELSKKVLLRDGESEEDSSMPVANRKSISCSHDATTDCLASQPHTKEDKDKDEDASTKHNETRLESKEEGTMDEHKHIEEGDENKKEGEEGAPDCEESRGFICPASPSFRVYFAEEETQNDTKNGFDQMKDAGVEDVSLEKPQSHDSVDSATSPKISEGQGKKTTKKGKKGTTFNRAVSKKRAAGVGMKNLLNVKSCYHLSCSGNEKTNLLA